MTEEVKPITLRLKKSTWMFLKKRCIDKETSLCGLINELLEKYKLRKEKKLTTDDTLVS